MLLPFYKIGTYKACDLQPHALFTIILPQLSLLGS